MKNINIYVHCANPEDATSFYRAWGVFPDIERRSQIRFHDFADLFRKYDQKNSYLHWPTVARCDIAFFQRSREPVIIPRVFHLQSVGVKIWYDIDDNYWEIPAGYKIKKNYTMANMETIEYMVENADLLTVSTAALAEYVNNKFGVNAQVINNGIDWDRFPMPIKPNLNSTTFWRGSDTHVQDLEEYRGYYEACSNITFMGYNPVENAPKLKVGGVFIGAKDPLQYYQILKQAAPTFMMTTLVDNAFNRCKSNVNYLEATLAGAISVNNQVGEFEGKGVMIGNAMLTQDQITEKYYEAVSDCGINYHLKTLNDKRIELICQL